MSTWKLRNSHHTYRRDREDRADAMQLRLGDRVSAEAVVRIRDIDEVDVALGSHGDQIRLLRMPLDSMERIWFCGRKNTKCNLSAINDISGGFAK